MVNHDMRRGGGKFRSRSRHHVRFGRFSESPGTVGVDSSEIKGLWTVVIVEIGVCRKSYQRFLLFRWIVLCEESLIPIKC